MLGWELVQGAVNERVIRYKVPGGWLYMVEVPNYLRNNLSSSFKDNDYWHPPVYVPDPECFMVREELGGE